MKRRRAKKEGEWNSPLRPLNLTGIYNYETYIVLFLNQINLCTSVLRTVALAVVRSHRVLRCAGVHNDLVFERTETNNIVAHMDRSIITNHLVEVLRSYVTSVTDTSSDFVVGQPKSDKDTHRFSLPF